jgi:hypothetical protein
MGDFRVEFIHDGKSQNLLLMRGEFLVLPHEAFSVAHLLPVGRGLPPLKRVIRATPAETIPTSNPSTKGDLRDAFLRLGRGDRWTFLNGQAGRDGAIPGVLRRKRTAGMALISGRGRFKVFKECA